MAHPEFLYYLAIACLTVGEFACRGAFGRMVWLLGAVFGCSFSAYLIGWNLPLAQLWLHAAGFVIGITISRSLPGHFTAAIFLPMVSVDLAQLLGMVSAATWWWAIYYMALAQLVALCAGANLHPLGAWVRQWAKRSLDRMEMRSLILRGL